MGEAAIMFVEEHYNIAGSSTFGDSMCKKDIFLFNESLSMACKNSCQMSKSKQ